MIPWIEKFVMALLYDEAAAQRWVGAALAYLAVFLVRGGVVPGTEYVIPLGDWAPTAERVGTVLFGLVAFIASGGKLPGITTPPPVEGPFAPTTGEPTPPRPPLPAINESR